MCLDRMGSPDDPGVYLGFGLGSNSHRCIGYGDENVMGRGVDNGFVTNPTRIACPTSGLFPVLGADSPSCG